MSVSISEFADRIAEVMPVIAKEFTRHQSHELFKGVVTLPQFLVLNFLDNSGESKMKDLAKFMDVTTAAMTGIVERLVKYGYVERVFDPEDRRIIKIKPTPKGSGLVKKFKEQKRQMVINIFGKLSEKDREDYLRIIMQIRDVLTLQRA